MISAVLRVLSPRGGVCLLHPSDPGRSLLGSRDFRRSDGVPALGLRAAPGSLGTHPTARRTRRGWSAGERGPRRATRVSPTVPAHPQTCGKAGPDRPSRRARRRCTAEPRETPDAQQREPRERSLLEVVTFRTRRTFVLVRLAGYVAPASPPTAACLRGAPATVPS